MAVGDGPLQRPAGGYQFRLGFGAGHAGDQHIHGRVLDTREVAGVFNVCRLAAKHVGVFLPWAVGARKVDAGDVELEFLQALLVQGIVHWAEVELDAEFFQVADPGGHGTGTAFIAVEVFEHKRLALGIAQRAVLDLPARLAQQFTRLEQVATQRIFSIRAGWFEGRPKSGRGQLRPQGLEQGQFFG